MKELTASIMTTNPNPKSTAPLGLGSSLRSDSEWLLPVVMLFVIIIAAVAFKLHQQSVDFTQAVNTGRNVVNYAANLLAALSDAETGQRGFLLTGRDEYLEPFKSGGKRSTELLASLLQITVNDPQQHQRTEAIRLLTEEKFAELNLTIKLFKTEGRKAALAVVNMDSGKNSMDQIRQIIQEIEAAEYNKLAPNVSATNKYERRAVSVVVGGSIALVVLLVMTLIIIKLANPQRDSHARQLRDHQALVLDLANDSITIRDNQDRVTYWNQGAQRLYGWSKEDALGQVTHTLFQTQFPEPLAEIQTQLLAQGDWKGELKHILRDGSLITVDSNWPLQRDDTNGLASVLEINTDITARKQAEREAGERTAELKAVNKELEEFAYVASHDLKAPLRVIDNASKWLEEDLQEHLTGEIAENLKPDARPRQAHG
jgi:PAS domain S-box-containing protein